MATEELWQFDTCEQISAILRERDFVRALWLSGSLARDDADRFSDIDLAVLVADATVGESVSNIEALLASKFVLVLVRNRGDEHHRLLNFVTEKWIRFDLNVYSPDGIAQSNLSGQRTVFDKDDLDLPVGHGEPPKRVVAAEDVYFAVSESIRVLGLLPVVMGRRDIVGAVTGSGLLRDLLVGFLQYEQIGQTRTGALNATRLLSPAASAAVLGLPELHAEESSILEFNRSCWDILIQFGPKICGLYDTEWPNDLVDAVRSRLDRELGVKLT